MRYQLLSLFNAGKNCIGFKMSCCQAKFANPAADIQYTGFFFSSQKIGRHTGNCQWRPVLAGQGDYIGRIQRIESFIRTEPLISFRIGNYVFNSYIFFNFFNGR